MNTHLSSEEMELALAGKATAATATHLQTCERCAAEVASLQELLGAMRSQATDAAAVYLHQPRQLAAAPRRPAQWAMAFAAAVLVVGGAVSPLALRHHVTPAVASGKPAVADTLSDDALLSSVQNDLSTSVPEPLLPLAGTSTTAKQTSIYK